MILLILYSILFIFIWIEEYTFVWLLRFVQKSKEFQFQSFHLFNNVKNKIKLSCFQNSWTFFWKFEFFPSPLLINATINYLRTTLIGRKLTYFLLLKNILLVYKNIQTKIHQLNKIQKWSCFIQIDWISQIIFPHWCKIFRIKNSPF